MAAPAASRRRPIALVVLDLAAGALVLLFTAVLALVAGGTIGVFPDLWLLVLCALLLITAWFGSLAMFAIRALQRRWAWFWPVLGGVLIVLVFNGGALLQNALL
jgi:hypothetical protein